jgi:hypothetical protein
MAMGPESLGRSRGIIGAIESSSGSETINFGVAMVDETCVEKVLSSEETAATLLANAFITLSWVALGTFQ